MTPRELAITKCIVLAMTEEQEILPTLTKDIESLIYKVREYGTCLALTREEVLEVLEVLKQPLIKLY